MQKILVISIIIILIIFNLVLCKNSSDRWTTTENTTVPIDWDKIMDAYKSADGPRDFEDKVNEIYEGDEIISVSVQDKDTKTQLVTGFFDNNKDGKVESDEKVFEIKRNITGEQQAGYEVNGHGSYTGYHHTGMWDIAGGMIIGGMLLNAMSPRYTPMYTQPYTTNQQRINQIDNNRNNFRASHPDKFTKSANGKGYESKSKKTWGSKGGKDWNKSGTSGFGGGKKSGGSSFGKRISFLRRKFIKFFIKRIEE